VTVHVVVASKHGSTREVAQAIADELGAELRDASEVDGFEGADAVILGSAIYGGRWLEPARKLVDDRAEELGRLPTWLFSVGPIGDPPKPEDAGPDGIDQVVASTRAQGHEVFAGKLDYAALGRLERMMVKALRAPEGYYRDWDAIRNRARSIASELDAS
jgi:menaquinone-dependent protoporphyrinogen oxidase